MKQLFYISSFFIASCFAGKNSSDVTLVKILNIDELSVDNQNLLVCRVNKDTAIIVSDKKNNQTGCDEIISVGDEIRLKLVKKY